LRRAVDVDEALNPIEATTRDVAVGLFGPPSEVTTTAATSGTGETSFQVAGGVLDAVGLPTLPPEGTCLVYSSIGDAGFFLAEAGEALDLEGPAGRSRLPWIGGEYRLSAPPEAPFLGPGSYHVEGPGGSGFPPFSVEIRSGEPVAWTARGDAEGEARVRGLSLAWTSPPMSPDSILLVGRDAIPPAAGSDTEIPATARFACAVSSGAQGFVIPPAVVANLPYATTALELDSLWGPRLLEFATDGPETGSLAYLDARQSSARLGQPHLPSTPVTLPDGTTVEAELAVSFAERQRGLMFRRELPGEQGMLFLFENPGHYGFWMLNTLVPLDILWLDSDRRIVFVSENTPPCPAGTFCPTYGSEAVGQFVLELAAGQAAAHGLMVGARLDW
jgi:uncharacterized membrane protein (UPF0127 family)